MINNKKLILPLIISLLALNINLSANPLADTYLKEWKSVDSLESKGLIKQALEKTETIIEMAKTEQNQVQQIKALAYKFKYQGQIVEKSDSLNIREMEAEIKEAAQPAQSILYSMLADMYYQYYQINRYRILNRTNLGKQTEDFQTWDAHTLLNKVADLYFLSLESEENLQKESLKEYEPILNKVKESETFRPTLYDLLAHRALTFFQTTESGITSPVEKFEPLAEDVFVSANQFINLKFETPDQASKKLKMLKIFQNLLTLHQASGPKAPYVDVELARLKYLENHAKGENNDTLYLKSLERLANEVKGDPASTEVSFAIAGLYNRRGNNYKPLESDDYQWDHKKALTICEEAIKEFPKSYGASQCKVLALSIKNPSLSLKTESGNLDDKPFRALVSYKNIKNLHYRIVKHPENITTQYYREKEVIKQLLGKPIIKQGKIGLNDLGDFQTHTSEVEMPDLASGRYVILASSSENYDLEKDVLNYVFTQVSGIAYFQRNYKGKLEVFITDRSTGKPLSGVTVKLYKRNVDSGKYSEYVGEFTSSKSGLVSIENTDRNYNNYKLELIHKDDMFSSGRLYLYPEMDRVPLPINKTFFFTDRKIYRPGQTVYFKTILLKQTGDKHEIRPNAAVEVTVYDVNHQEVSTISLTSNEFGTAHGSFVAPASGLLGTMSLEAVGGYHDISIEEYKRPKFEASFDPIKGLFALNDEVTMEGKATSYSGANITGATVNYRVVRQVNYPYWYGYFWRFPRPRSESREIVNGTTTTDESGKFSIPFTLIPDDGVKKSTKPVFTYAVYADVVDITGETHSANSSVRAGYVGLDVSINVPNTLNPANLKPLTIETKNLNGTFEAATGNLKITQLDAPNQVFRKRKWQEPDQKLFTETQYRQIFPYDLYENEDDFKTWKENPVAVLDQSFDTGTNKEITADVLKNATPGKYKLELTAKDKSGEEIKIVKFFTLENPESKKAALPVVLDLLVDKSTAEPGETIVATLSTTEKRIWVRFDIEQKGKLVSSRLLKVKRKKKTRIEIPIIESYRGNIAISAVTVRHNEFHQDFKIINIPWTNKELKLSWSTFRDKLLPGQEEQWKLKITGHKSQAVAAEMVASLYDASLDEFRSNAFSLSLYKKNYRQISWNGHDGFGLSNSRSFQKNQNRSAYPRRRGYDQLNWFGGLRGRYDYQFAGAIPSPRAGRAMDLSENMNLGFSMDASAVSSNIEADALGDTFGSGEQKTSAAKDSLESNLQTEKSEEASTTVPIRSNLNETAFFFPQLETNEDGEIILNFTMPEALTRWKFLGLAHTKDLEIGTIGGETVTQKELMVTPNQPRFFREGDKMTFSAKVTNLSEEALTGEARISILDAFSRKPVNAVFNLREISQPFIVAAGQNSAVSWELEIPADVPAVVVQVTAKAGDFSDGEEHVIPVLRNSILVTESIPLAVRGEENKEFTFNKLVASGESETLKHQKLTLEFTSNPAWYAVQSLPYLMEFPHECTEQIFSRFYANSLASHIADKSPKVRTVFDQWRNSVDNDPGAFLSNLEKNQDLKSVLLSETPWVLNARAESERKRRVGLLFDVNRMSEEMSKTRQQLLKRQLPSGGFSWFPGMSPSRYITQLIVEGMGHLQKLNVSTAEGNPEINKTLTDALGFLDREIQRDFSRINKSEIEKKKDHLGSTQIQYLYARSFFTDIPLAAGTSEAYNYYYNQAKKYWVEKSRYMQGMLALTLDRSNDASDARKIMASLKETAIYNPELGMYWKRNNGGWYWYQAPIEEHALMIEAFNEVSGDDESVEELKIWLLKNKQTSDWKTTRATAAACNALLSTGSDWLDQNEIVAVTLGEIAIDPFQREDTKVEAGTGYFKTSWDKSEIKPEMGNIKVSKKDKGIAWGSLYWQYFEEMDKITYAETPLSLKKEVYKVVNTDTGPKLVSTDESALKTGDKIRVRIELRVDRPMEYVHMKDLRASAFEPVNVLSTYKYQAGLGYYQSTKDAATHFFFDYLPKGTHVFEYDLYATQKGDFANGITTIQCMYAPEFTSHSEGIRVEVK